MSTSKRKYESTIEKPWLQQQNDNAKSRIYKLGVRAIQSLLKDAATISYRNIAARSKELDELGVGIHPNSVKNNSQLYEYYLKHAKIKTKSTRTNKIRVGEIDFKNIKFDRDVERVKGRYMQMSKRELVELLINAEQYIAEQNQTWIRSQFEANK
ncbi:hypothetical protein GK047_12725 [Paenibacillus sp. SYP-B3998]|uniref:Uncharacterized protein n=1 Tax=Paenibacillus sp. SYP-B3998 TaxID=2678564 RepID=A0A6G3ZZ62_9BACL|nr:hypothetical protein [Paenibacillus sp. SYP-B3998]NEW06869.1 hypothetical protein [Paenibacillus sp. SYP-B3998]